MNRPFIDGKVARVASLQVVQIANQYDSRQIQLRDRPRVVRETPTDRCRKSPAIGRLRLMTYSERSSVLPP